eukprot:m.274621 g.274621  ORF g.274621 m.274621 type:complete len:64 (+) comp26901_c2_seq3:3374-3565(+)
MIPVCCHSVQCFASREGEDQRSTRCFEVARLLADGSLSDLSGPVRVEVCIRPNSSRVAVTMVP